MIKKNILLMNAISLLQGMVFYAPIATLYREAQGVSIFQITIIESISLALCLLLELPWGILADRIGYRKTFLFCCCLYLVSKLVFWQASGFAGFLLERVLLSIVMAGISGVDISILYLSCPPDKSQRIFGIFNSLQTAGMLLASLTYSLFIGEQYRLAGLLTVFSYGLAALLSLGITEVHPVEQPTFSVQGFVLLLRGTLRNRSLLLMLIGIALLNETHQTVTVFLSQLQYVRCGLSSSGMGLIHILLTLVGMGSIFSARLTERIGEMRFGLLQYIIAGTSCLLLALTQSAWLSILLILLLRISFSLFQPLQEEWQNRLVQTEDRATALSINALLMDSVGVATNVAFGRLADSSLPSALYAGAGLCGFGMFLLFWARRKLQKPVSPTIA